MRLRPRAFTRRLSGAGLVASRAPAALAEAIECGDAEIGGQGHAPRLDEADPQPLCWDGRGFAGREVAARGSPGSWRSETAEGERREGEADRAGAVGRRAAGTGRRKWAETELGGRRRARDGHESVRHMRWSALAVGRLRCC